jgi:carboxyl-terminal processing protease
MPAPIPRSLCLSAAFLAFGCLFDSKYSIQEMGAQVVKTEALDTVVRGDATPSRTVELYQPFLDPALKPGQASAPEVSKSVNVKDHNDSGRIVQYRLTRQRFGSWNPDLEFKWNWFQLSANWIFPAGLPDTSALAGQTGKLYEALHGEDPFTRYFDSAAAPGIWNLINNSTKPGAIGVMVAANAAGDTVRVKLVVAGSPADRAGIAKGMAILAVGDSAVTGDSALQRFGRFNSGDSGSTVSLTVMAPGGDPSVRRLTRVPVAFPTVIVDSLDGVAYLAVTGFTPNTIGGKSTWTELKDALALTRRYRSTILDLRDNGGGSLDLAMRMCDEILPADQVIIRQVERRFDELALAPIETEIATIATAGGAGEKGPDGTAREFLLLANGNTASAAEIFIVAVREGAGARLMGQKTFGKGVGQTVRNTPGRGLSLITFLKFTSAAHLDYHKKGIDPDYPDSAAGDELLAHAVVKAREAAAGGAAAKRSANGERGFRAAIAAAEWNRRQAAIRPAGAGSPGAWLSMDSP